MAFAACPRVNHQGALRLCRIYLRVWLAWKTLKFYLQRFIGTFIEIFFWINFLPSIFQKHVYVEENSSRTCYVRHFNTDFN